jgi:hypothetical protein
LVGNGDVVTEHPGEGIEIKRGCGTLFVPESHLQKIDKIAEEGQAEDEIARAAGKTACQHCGQWFMPRARSGGRPQKYCRPECTRAADAERKAGTANPHQPESQPAESPALAPSEDVITPVVNLDPWQGRIDRQYAIEIAGVPNCGSTDVHIEQEGQHGFGDESSTIIVTAANAVRVARMILWAAGFRSVTIAAGVKGGWVDVEDGQEADQFEWVD